MLLVQVLFSRWLGQLKQGLLHDGDNGAWQVGQELEQLLQHVPQTKMHEFEPEAHRFVRTS